ncbi:YiiX/YebB-like N1pC/P60 family cysteine hydrolase [Fontisubflavum oceani]|uniref:YiiX/YebB-like N1pC/P60 family cysteine hydrolase n=1 Tax=Fontisubflavum oceani TaxID=2978973 RepID=UPI0025B3BB92|nr:YiiX/YebB-like N1pC/P60 family cysteine hydrolase [Fontisubflavum oceani]WJY21788.1 YiiX/YebB-like N1pC/P60 family cysteine hydrolase [Fontisubflavum oceani]
MTEKIVPARDSLLDRIGRRMARKLNRQSSGYQPYTPSDFPTLCRVLRPGDVILIEGSERISNAIKYLTQSTWSHAALYVGDVLPEPEDGSERPRLVEVNLGEGCVAVPLSKYQTFNTRICRAAGLNEEERAQVADFMIGNLGLRYDMRNIFDLARYFLPTPPVPIRWRRRMLAFGSGDPTRAICSSLIAQAFQSIRYPILPERRAESSEYAAREIYHIRHHSLFAPRDFDLSPYFRVVKPTLEDGFDFREIEWGERAEAEL